MTITHKSRNQRIYVGRPKKIIPLMFGCSYGVYTFSHEDNVKDFFWDGKTVSWCD